MYLRQVSVLVLVAVGALSATAQGRDGSVSLTQKSLTVAELFSLVESNSSSLQAAKTGVQFADLGVASAKTDRLPDVSTSLSASFNGNVLITNREFGDVHGYHAPHFGNSFALEARQTVYTGGAQSAAVRMAEIGREQALAGVDEARRQVRFVALGQYLDLLKLSNGMQVYEHNIRLTERLIDNIREKHAQGMVLLNDVTRYELQMETLRLGLRKLSDQRSILNHQLCTTLRLAEGTQIVPADDVTDGFQQAVPAGEPDAACPADASMDAVPAEPPSLRMARLNVEQARQHERMAKSERRPKVAFFAIDQLAGPFTYDIPPVDKNVNYWCVGIGLTYNLSALFKNSSKIRQAHTDTQRQNQLETLEQERFGNDMQSAETLYKQSYVEWQTQQKSVELATQNYQIVNDRYLNQLALVTDMVDASNLKLNAELQEVNARIGIIYAYYRIKYITGTI